jgi:hypothetical protein
MNGIKEKQDNYFVLVEQLSFSEKFFPLVKELDLVIFSDKKIFETFFEKIDFDSSFVNKKGGKLDLEKYFKKRYGWSSLEFLKNRNLVYLLYEKGNEKE